MLDIRENMLHAFVFVQVIFAALAVFALAFAQAIGANIGIVSVLAVFGGCVLVEMIVFTGIFVYMRFAGCDYANTLNDAAYAVKSASKHVIDAAGDAVDSIKTATEAKKASASETVNAENAQSEIQIVIEESSSGESRTTSMDTAGDDDALKINNAKHAKRDNEEK